MKQRLPYTTDAQARTPQRSKPRAQQRGNAILFTLLALVIGGIVIAVGVTQYQDAERAVRIQNTISEVNTIIGTAKQNYGQYRYVGLSTEVAVGSRVIPADLHVTQGGKTASNKFGGAIDLAATTNAATGTATLTYKGVPIELCTAIVHGTQASADSINVGTKPVKSAGAQVSVDNLHAECGKAGAAVDISWIFART